MNIIGPFFSALFGAGAAFAFNALRTRLTRREEQLTTINAAIYGLLMTFSTLINYKKQFLTEFEIEFEHAQALLGEMNPGASQEELATLAHQVGTIFTGISNVDQTLGGVFKVWQEITFPMMPKPEDLYFTVSGSPDLVRLIHVAREEALQVERQISIRNKKWESNVQKALQDAKEKVLDVNTMLFWFEMLNIRTVIRTHTDTALVVIFEDLRLLKDYRSASIPKRRWLARKLFGKDVWTDYRIPPEWAELVPNKDGYKKILCLPSELP